ncbi:SLATT domain-containing protein [Acidovorax sp. sic0104]|uniref:SLATT domain-containing protein n=1 Tax=Acidovorax sp. sic0104 TaxID=2854784 RepID=UPI001C45A8FA|nr:SLATT domain-containing protein [Acidovorax sp. sic0104]MBV7544292.1 SLATT domain-containing protein [Acidovorax sp. sic0104]
MSAEPSADGALALIEELRVDAKLGKGKHFAASDRKLLWHRLCGIPVILANLFVGIVLLNLQGQASSPATTVSAPAVTASVPTLVASAPMAKNDSAATGSLRAFLSSDALALLSVVLAFSAASLSGVQTFFNFYKSFEGHRAIGNRYTHLSRQCKALQQKHRDLSFDPKSLWEHYEKLIAEYNQINIDGEAFPTSASDLKKARNGPVLSRYQPPAGTPQ